MATGVLPVLILALVTPSVHGRLRGKIHGATVASAPVSSPTATAGRALGPLEPSSRSRDGSLRMVPVVDDDDDDITIDSRLLNGELPITSVDPLSDRREYALPLLDILSLAPKTSPPRA